MFSSFSAYLFGGGKDGSDCGKENDYTTVEADGDWLIVEKHKHTSNLSGDECEPHHQPLKASDHNLPSNGALTCCNTANCRPSASHPSSPTPMACLEGSWYITPPSCFTAGPPFNVQVSPLENLLIEHPSMSVYASINDCELAAEQAPTEGENLDHRGLAANQTSTNSRLKQILEASSRTVRHNNRQQSSIAGKAGLLEQIQNQAEVQKVKQRLEAKFVHGKQLDRRNKAQEFQSAGKRHRRKDFMKTPSGKSNNRKY